MSRSSSAAPSSHGLPHGSYQSLGLRARYLHPDGYPAGVPPPGQEGQSLCLIKYVAEAWAYPEEHGWHLLQDRGFRPEVWSLWGACGSVGIAGSCLFGNNQPKRQLSFSLFLTKIKKSSLLERK